MKRFACPATTIATSDGSATGGSSKARELVLKVTIHVSEENDALVRINVGSEMVADGIPPWIARRRMGEDVDVAIDIAQRKLFYQYLEEAVANAVAEFRAGGDRPYAR